MAKLQDGLQKSHEVEVTSKLSSDEEAFDGTAPIIQGSDNGLSDTAGYEIKHFLYYAQI